MVTDISTTCALVIFWVMSVTVNNSPIQDYAHLDDHAPPSYEDSNYV